MSGTFIPEQGKVTGFLTDGTGVSSITLVKFLKDFVADALMGAAAALVAIQVITVDAALAAPQVAAFAVLGAVIRAGYRAALRWATTEA